MVEYLVLIDRPTHLVHVAPVDVAIVGGHVVPVTIPFSETLPDAHDELQSAFDVHVVLLHLNMVHPGVGGVVLDVTQSYLTNLDFVKDASGCKTHFGRIPQAVFRTYSKTGIGVFQGWSSPRFFQ